MTKGGPLNILDSYISEWVLPGDPIVSWLKWTENTEFNNIVLKFEADVFIHIMLNVDEKVLEQDMKSGKITIPKEYLQLPGFFGFHAFYTSIPPSERNVEFIIDFMENDEVIHTERKSTLIIRPRLQMEVSPSDIMITDNIAPAIDQIQCKLINTGSAGIKSINNINLTHFSTPDLKVVIQRKTTDTNRYDKSSPNESFDSLSLNGKGHAIIKISAEYTDYKGNIYRDYIGEITIDIRQNIDYEIPVNRSSEDVQSVLLVSS